MQWPEEEWASKSAGIADLARRMGEAMRRAEGLGEHRELPGGGARRRGARGTWGLRWATGKTWGGQRGEQEDGETGRGDREERENDEVIESRTGAPGEATRGTRGAQRA